MLIFNLLADASANKLNYHNQTITNQRFVNQKLSNANFSGAKLTAVAFINCDLTGANFSNSILDQVQFSGIGQGLNLSHANFDGAILSNIIGLVDLLHDNQVLAHDASFRGTKFNNISFVKIKLLDNFDFTGAIFSGQNSSFENAEFGPDVIFVNTQFNGEPYVFTFRDTDVYPAGAYYSARNGLSFFNVKINGTNFSNAIFRYTNFSAVQNI